MAKDASMLSLSAIRFLSQEDNWQRWGSFQIHLQVEHTQTSAVPICIAEISKRCKAVFVEAAG